MKLTTTIAPRRDGTVIAKDLEGRPYTFEADPAFGGALCADVDDDEALVYLLGTGHFEPADEADYPQASALVPADPDPDGDDDGDDDGEESPGGLPVEANTPAAKMPGRAARRARAAT
jgi:hypothetical protein